MSSSSLKLFCLASDGEWIYGTLFAYYSGEKSEWVQSSKNPDWLVLVKARAKGEDLDSLRWSVVTATPRINVKLFPDLTYGYVCGVSSKTRTFVLHTAVQYGYDYRDFFRPFTIYLSTEDDSKLENTLNFELVSDSGPASWGTWRADGYMYSTLIPVSDLPQLVSNASHMVNSTSANEASDWILATQYILGGPIKLSRSHDKSFPGTPQSELIKGFTPEAGDWNPSLVYNNGSLYGFAVRSVNYTAIDTKVISAQLISSTSDTTAVGLTANSTREYTITDIKFDYSKSTDSHNLIASSGQYTHVLSLNSRSEEDDILLILDRATSKVVSKSISRSGVPAERLIQDVGTSGFMPLYSDDTGAADSYIYASNGYSYSIDSSGKLRFYEVKLEGSPFTGLGKGKLSHSAITLIIVGVSLFVGLGCAVWLWRWRRGRKVDTEDIKDEEDHREVIIEEAQSERHSTNSSAYELSSRRVDSQQ